MIRFASLGSGSKGNALLVEADGTRVLVDCGFGPRELSRRLARLAVTPESIHAVLVTHEHHDHAAGVARCAARYGWAVHASFGTAVASHQLRGLAVCRFDSHDSFALDGLEIQPVPVPHDAREPTQFVFSDGASRLGVLTDAGTVTPHMIAMFSECSALVLECNHDATMLANGRYPLALKQRIAGAWGHLANDQAAELLRAVASSRLRHVVAAHLSEENNTPALARAALADALGCSAAWIDVADQNHGFSWRTL